MLEISMGQWDLTIYDEIESPRRKFIGKLFELFVTVTNMLVLVNLIIAIMSDTYAYYVGYRKGLFSKNIIEAVPSYMNDKHYGSLICTFPPFNVISVLILPLLLFIDDREGLMDFNMMLCKLIHLPVLVLTSLLFFASSLLMVPFAYVKMLTLKYRLYKKSSEEVYRKFVMYLLIGIPILLISCFTDLYWFVKHSLTWDL